MRSDTRAEQAGQIRPDNGSSDRRAGLVRDQHLVHQRNGQVGRHQIRGGRCQRQQETGQQAATVRTGELPEAQQRPGRRRRADGAHAQRTFVVVRRQRRLAARTYTLFILDGEVRMLPVLDLPRMLVGQSQRFAVQGERVAPGGEPSARIMQCERAHAGVIGVLNVLTGSQRPFLPRSAG
jgi:hypothetical protein